MGVLETLGIRWQVMVLQIGAFGLVFLLLKLFAFGPLGAILRQREEEVSGNLERAAAQAAEQQRLREELEARLSRIHEEARAEVKKAVEEARQVREQLLGDARSEAERFLSRAQAEIENRRRSALKEMRDQVADLAMIAAGKAIGETLDEAAHRRVIDDFIASLELHPESKRGA
jgi:F-type H+-transporting ATPase subunit b